MNTINDVLHQLNGVLEAVRKAGKDSELKQITGNVEAKDDRITVTFVLPRPAH